LFVYFDRRQKVSAIFMDPQLAELRKLQAQRYKSLPEEKKPHIPTCPDCNKQIYDSPVCQKTGFLHNRHTDRLVAGLLVDGAKRQFSGQELMAAIDAVRVRWQPSRVSLIKADSTSLNIFQSFVYSLDWKMQRYGILYGRVVGGESSGEKAQQQVEVHAIYEPEQIGKETSFTLLDDPREATVDKIAASLGLRRVGCVCTHAPRDETAVTLSGAELLLCAKEQSKFGDHCVLVTMGPNLESGQIHAQCWQASQQCVRYFQMGILSENPDSIVSILSKVPLEIAQEDQDKPGHTRVVIKESSTVVDTRWMTSYIAVEPFTSTVVGNNFIRISRAGCAPPTMSNAKIFLQDSKRAKLPFLEKIADFHLLIFLSQTVFDVDCDLPPILQGIASRQSANAADFVMFEEILNERLK
jgi:nuclear protein localization protein 4 homolog